jgi:hypothetical protein
MGHKDPLEPIAFDIETQGLLMHNEITVAGLRFPLGALVLVNTNGRTVPGELETRVHEQSGLDVVKVNVCDSERDLLERLRKEAEERLRGKNRMLVAFNGETWRGGFDLSFLRTRCGLNDVLWPFDDIPYADLMPLVQKRVNTTVDGEDSPTEIGDLCGAYDALIGGDHCDPYEDSSEAVSADYNGDWESLVLHNVADIDRTQQLADWMQRYVPASDFKLKNLGPPRSRRW